MMTLRECVAQARGRRVAVGHFNVSDTEQLYGVVRAAHGLGAPVIVGLSEGERDFLGVRQAVALIRSIREELGHPVYVNADHTYTLERVREAVDAGYDAVVVDGSKLPFEENVAFTKTAVEYARGAREDILVEGELGWIGASSKLLDEIPAEALRGSLTKPEELREFVRRTRVDLVAPAVGSVHGLLRRGEHPKLDIPRVRELSAAADVPLVLHGGSGVPAESMGEAIRAGIAIVHVNSEIRLAYRRGIEESLAANRDEIAPYRFMDGGRRAVERVVREKIQLFINP